MNILVVSLLRLGDVLMILPILRGLKTQHPGARLHLLLNRQCASLQGFMPFVDEFHYFDREFYQERLANASASLMEPVDELIGWAHSLSQHRFHTLINLTQNRLSARLCALIEAREKIGLEIDSDDKPRFGSSSFQYLNADQQRPSEQIFHFTDIFWNGSRLTGRPEVFLWPETERGRREADALGLAEAPLVFQPFTSDEKKNWGVQNWAQLALRLKKAYPQTPLVALGAEFEKDALLEFVALAAQHGVTLQPAVVSLEGALSLLNRARALVTGDTAIKHLASFSQTKVLELSLGSSDWRRTGVYKPESFILASSASCAPCEPSQGCRQSTHRCARDISPQDVFDVLTREVLKTAPAASGSARVLKTSQSAAGFWLATSDESLLEQSLEKTALKIHLDGEHRDLVGPYGTKCRGLKEMLRQEKAGLKLARWMVNRESRWTADESELGRLLALLPQAARDLGDNETLRSWLQDLWRLQERIGEVWMEAADAPPSPSFGFFRHLQMELQRAHEHLCIKLKLIRTLQLQMAVE